MSSFEESMGSPEEPIRSLEEYMSSFEESIGSPEEPIRSLEEINLIP